MSDRTKAYFEEVNTPLMDVDAVDLLHVPKKLWCECCADIHPSHMSRTFTSEVPSRICPRCKEELMERVQQMPKHPNFQAMRDVDAVAMRGAKPISHIAYRQKERGE